MVLDFERTCGKYKLELLLSPLSEDDPLFGKIDEIASSAVLKNELDDLKAADEKLAFMDIYMTKYKSDVTDRRLVLQQRCALLETAYSNLLKKEDAEQLVMELLGGTRNQVNDKITDMLGAFRNFKEHKDEKMFAMQAKGNL